MSNLLFKVGDVVMMWRWHEAFVGPKTTPEVRWEPARVTNVSPGLACPYTVELIHPDGRYPRRAAEVKDLRPLTADSLKSILVQ